MTFSTKTFSAEKEQAVFIFAHGAGAGMASDFIQDMARLLCERNITVICFNFPYMQTMVESNKRRPPDKIDKLEAHFLALTEAIASSAAVPVFIGGKSMGGRVSTRVLEKSGATGAIVFGYPFHPPGKPDKLRTEHLEKISKPVCIVQGERDTFGTQQEVTAYSLSDKVKVHFLPDGDHSLKPRKASGYQYSEHLISAADTASKFIYGHLSC